MLVDRGTAVNKNHVICLTLKHATRVRRCKFSYLLVLVRNVEAQLLTPPIF